MAQRAQQDASELKAVLLEKDKLLKVAKTRLELREDIHTFLCVTTDEELIVSCSSPTSSIPISALTHVSKEFAQRLEAVDSTLPRAGQDAVLPSASTPTSSGRVTTRAQLLKVYSEHPKFLARQLLYPLLTRTLSYEPESMGLRASQLAQRMLFEDSALTRCWRSNPTHPATPGGPSGRDDSTGQRETSKSLMNQL